MSDDQPDPAGQQRIPVALSGVPETLLWTLYYRAREAGRPDGVLIDPLAVQLVRRLDYPFAERLGHGSSRAQWQGLRARTFDQRIAGFLAAHPGGTVVALGEGLETQFWRVDEGTVRWLGVDLPAAAETRRQALPAHPRREQFEGSALEDGWMDRVDPAAGVLITAQGLLMYLPREQVHDLLIRCARRFPGAELVFDGVPQWTSKVTTAGAGAAARSSRAAQPGRPRRTGAQGRGTLQPPAMSWWMDSREAGALRRLPGVADVRRLHPPRGRGLLMGVELPVVERLPVLRAAVLSVWSARFS